MSHDFAFEIAGTAIGGAAAVSNVIEIVLLGRKGRKRTEVEEIILSLSCADMLVGITFLCTWSITSASGIQYEHNKNIAAKISDIFLIFCFNTSVFHILTIAVERFYAVRYPFKYRAVITKEITRKMIIALWVLSISVVTCFAVPDILKSSNLLGVFKGIFIFTSGVVVVIIYGYLGYMISRRDKSISSAREKISGMSTQKQLRDTIFSYAVATSYIICSFPFAVVMAFRMKKHFKFAELMLVINSLIDPILYFWKGYYDKSQEKNLSIRVKQETHGFGTDSVMMNQHTQI